MHQKKPLGARVNIRVSWGSSVYLDGGIFQGIFYARVDAKSAIAYFFID